MGYFRSPYCKPTQVDRKRILRPTGEGLLRNSANLPRNLGIRGALVVIYDVEWLIENF